MKNKYKANGFMTHNAFHILPFLSHGPCFPDIFTFESDGENFKVYGFMNS